MAIKKSDSNDEIQVLQVKRGRIEVCILGSSPILFHRMGSKARRELLMPSPKKKAAEKASTLKHDPYFEFRDSADQDPNPKAETLLLHKTSAFKSAMRGAAIDMPGGATKAAIGRLAYVNGDWTPIFGIPKLHMDVVRMSDINRTPDIRTRIVCPEWACRISVTFTEPILKKQAVMNLLAGAGITQGIGDGRPEKGKLNYGCFDLVDEDNKDFQRVIRDGGRAAQLEAMKIPECYDAQTAELLGWFTDEATRREFDIQLEV
jgi:hypothetical protein